MHHQLMKTTVRSKGRRCISSVGCLLLRKGKLNFHQEMRDLNRWRDHSQCNSAGIAEPILVKHGPQNQATAPKRSSEETRTYSADKCCWRKLVLVFGSLEKYGIDANMCHLNTDLNHSLVGKVPLRALDCDGEDLPICGWKLIPQLSLQLL